MTWQDRMSPAPRGANGLGEGPGPGNGRTVADRDLCLGRRAAGPSGLLGACFKALQAFPFSSDRDLCGSVGSAVNLLDCAEDHRRGAAN